MSYEGMAVNESSLYLGLDIGTSGVKAVLLDAAGELRYEASVGYQPVHARPLWSEQDPQLWWNACREAIGRLALHEAPLARVAAIGVAGQMHGATLLGAGGRVLRPAILWNDGRSHRECAELMERVPDLEARTGNLCMPGFTAPKLLWLARHEPRVLDDLEQVLLPKDYIVHCLTGGYSSDMSDASGTLWLNPALRDWDDTLLAACGLDRGKVPRLYEGSDIVGELRADVAETLGLPVVPVVAGGGDNACGAVGTGIVAAGDGFLSLGTSGVIFVAADRHRALPERTVHAFCHCLPGRWHQMGVTLSAAQSLHWLAGVAGVAVADLNARLEARPRSDNPLLFLPYLSGERTPHNDPSAVGVFHGLRADTTLEDMALAVLEGVAFSQCDGLAALRAAGARVERLTLIGGGARSALWRQVCSDALDLPMDYRASGAVGPAFGAARLARIGVDPAGVEAAITAVCTVPALVATHEPDRDRHERLAAKYRRYQALYQATRPLNPTA